MNRSIRYIENQMPLIYIRFYVVGLILFAIRQTRPFFISITTLSLVLVIASVFWFNRDKGRRQILWGIFIVLSSFLLEYYGVATGNLFGPYSYGRGLAPLIKGTPVIIGFNWLFLIYSTHLIANRICHSPAARIICGSALMILYDLVVEWVAPSMNMWSFSGGYPPLRNFVIWLGASIIYHSGFEILPLKYDNYPARILYIIQLVFFLLIGIISSIAIR